MTSISHLQTKWREEAIREEREKIADWLDIEIFSGFKTCITHVQARMIAKVIRSGSYQDKGEV